METCTYRVHTNLSWCRGCLAPEQGTYHSLSAQWPVAGPCISRPSHDWPASAVSPLRRWVIGCLIFFPLRAQGKSYTPRPERLSSRGWRHFAGDRPSSGTSAYIVSLQQNPYPMLIGKPISPPRTHCVRIPHAPPKHATTMWRTATRNESQNPRSPPPLGWPGREEQE